MKVVIVGGVAAGATAAARLRRLDEQAEILIFERSGYISYANCGLPYYIGDVITDPEALTLQTPEQFFARFRVQVRVRHEVTALHPERKTVSVTDLATSRTFEESYDKLILAPGAKTYPAPAAGCRPGTGVHTAYGRGYLPHQGIYSKKQIPLGGAGRRRLYRSGTGRKSAGAGHGSHHRAAA